MGAFTNEMKAKPQNAFAVQAINDLRTGYRHRMAEVEALENSILTSLVGGKKLPKKPDAILERLMKGEKPDLVFVREFLESSETGQVLLGQLRATHIQRIAQTSFNPSQPHADFGVRLNKLASNLAGHGGRSGKAGMGIHEPAVQAELVAVGKALRILNNKYFVGVVPGGTKLEEIAINVISRSPEFMARFLTRALSGGANMERALLDPATRKALIELAARGPTDRLGKAAMVTLASFIHDSEEAERNDAEAAAEAARAKMMQSMSVR